MTCYKSSLSNSEKRLFLVIIFLHSVANGELGNCIREGNFTMILIGISQ